MKKKNQKSYYESYFNLKMITGVLVINTIIKFNSKFKILDKFLDKILQKKNYILFKKKLASCST